MASRVCQFCQRQARHSSSTSRVVSPSSSSASSSSTRFVASAPRPPLRRPPSTSRQQAFVRDLPPIQSRNGLYAVSAVLAIATWSAFVYYATHNERANSSVFRSLTFQLRTNERVRELLGDDVKPVELVPGFTQVHGNVNMLSGKVDIQFRVQGTKGVGTANFTSIRREKGDKFQILRWKITKDDGTVLDLASDDPRNRLSTPAEDERIV